MKNNGRKFPGATSANTFESLVDQISPKPTEMDCKWKHRRYQNAEQEPPLTSYSIRLELVGARTETDFVILTDKWTSTFQGPDIGLVDFCAMVSGKKKAPTKK